MIICFENFKNIKFHIKFISPYKFYIVSPIAAIDIKNAYFPTNYKLTDKIINNTISNILYLRNAYICKCLTHIHYLRKWQWYLI